MIVFSSTLEDHIVQLGQVFERLQRCGLKLLPDNKCSFAQASLGYLGHCDYCGGHCPIFKEVSSIRKSMFLKSEMVVG